MMYNICILIVDDEIPILKMLRQRLERLGITVEIASNGKQAVQKLNDNYYDLILLDIKMPEIDGGQMLDYIKFQRRLEVPVVGMSGTPWLLHLSGFDAVLPKPFSMEKLQDVIQKFCYR